MCGAEIRTMYLKNNRKSRYGKQSIIMANATNKDIQFHFFFMVQALPPYNSKNYSATKMEGDATESWSRMRGCADHDKKGENVAGLGGHLASANQKSRSPS